MNTDEQQSANDDYWRECTKIRPDLMRFATRRCATHCRGSVEPEDIVQEAFIRGAEFSNLELEKLQPFLVTVINRLCVDEARRRAVAIRMARHPRLQPIATEEPGELVCDQAEARWLAARLRHLSARDRRLVALLVAGRAHHEIAAELSTTPQSTYSAIYRLRRRISPKR
jgi:RNA polymerase sigma-70 factor (ECF subfamily)